MYSYYCCYCELVSSSVVVYVSRHYADGYLRTPTRRNFWCNEAAMGQFTPVRQEAEFILHRSVERKMSLVQVPVAAAGPSETG